MIQTYNDMSCQVRQFQNNWNGDGQIQKIYSSARFVSLSLRSMGKTVYLCFGRGKGYEGFWLGEKQIPSPLRKIDQFLEYLRKHISGARLLGVEQDSEDRVIYVKYQKFGKECALGLFYCGRKLYFANYYYNLKTQSMELFRSWSKAEALDKSLSESFREMGKSLQNLELRSKEVPSIASLLEKEAKEGLVAPKSVQKGSKFLLRKKRNIKADLERNQLWPELKNWLEGQDDLGALEPKLSVAGFKLRFREKSHFKRRDEVYEKIKKLKKGEAILRERLDEVEKLESGKVEIVSEKSILEVLKPVWSKNAPAKQEVASATDDGYKLVKDEGFEAGIGLSAKGNDQLRKAWAKKDDWWFHLDAGTSPHIIIKASVISPAILEKVARLMRDYNPESKSEINLIYTQVKNLKGISGKAGSVNYKKEKRVRIYV